MIAVSVDPSRFANDGCPLSSEEDAVAKLVKLAVACRPCLSTPADGWHDSNWLDQHLLVPSYWLFSWCYYGSMDMGTPDMKQEFVKSLPSSLLSRNEVIVEEPKGFSPLRKSSITLFYLCAIFVLTDRHSKCQCVLVGWTTSTTTTTTTHLQLMVQHWL